MSGVQIGGEVKAEGHAQAATAEEGAKSDATWAATQEFFNKALAEYKAGRFDISELGEAYEGIAISIPLAGQYVEARRALFDWADKQGFGKEIRTLYHGAETGARVTAAIATKLPELAAANYGADSAAAISMSNLAAGIAGPIGLGVAAATVALTFIFGGGEDPAVERAQRIAARDHARAALKALATWPPEAKKVFESTPYFRTLNTLAQASIDDPLAFIEDPEVREGLRLGIFKATGKILDDPAIVSTLKLRLAARRTRPEVQPRRFPWKLATLGATILGLVGLAARQKAHRDAGSE